MPYTSIPFVVYGKFKGFLPVVAILTIVVLAFDFPCKHEHFFTPVLIDTWAVVGKRPKPYMLTSEIAVCVVGMFIFILGGADATRFFLQEYIAKWTIDVATKLCIDEIA